jgi:hypothetical protein
MRFIPTRQGVDTTRRAPLRAEPLESRVAPAVFVVTSAEDTLAENLLTGEDALGQITLRAALMAANHRGGSNTIQLPAGTYRLSELGADEDDAASGDLDVKNDLTVVGPGGTGTITVIIDGNLSDRIFQVFADFSLTLDSVELQAGLVVSGAGATARGGALYNDGTLTLLNSTVAGTARGFDANPLQAVGSAEGGAIYNTANGALTALDCTVSGTAGGCARSSSPRSRRRSTAPSAPGRSTPTGMGLPTPSSFPHDWARNVWYGSFPFNRLGGFAGNPCLRTPGES